MTACTIPPENRIPRTVHFKPTGPERAAEIVAELKTLCRNHLRCRYIFPETAISILEFALTHYFKKLRAARKDILFEGCALSGMTVEPGPDGFLLLTPQTAFAPWPRYGNMIGVPHASAPSMRPLGMYEEYDLYAVNREGNRVLTARGPGSACLEHNLTRDGVPPDAPPLREAYRRHAILSFQVAGPE